MMRPRAELEGSGIECCDVVLMNPNLHREFASSVSGPLSLDPLFAVRYGIPVMWGAVGRFPWSWPPHIPARPSSVAVEPARGDQ